MLSLTPDINAYRFIYEINQEFPLTYRGSMMVRMRGVKCKGKSGLTTSSRGFDGLSGEGRRMRRREGT